ncbi:hypothetical protein Avbf_12152 [Armadillidium vulgare]|nr:hypothetical protein Avbf_12152 [Armadillidium vulgare]
MFLCSSQLAKYIQETKKPLNDCDYNIKGFFLRSIFFKDFFLELILYLDGFLGFGIPIITNHLRAYSCPVLPKIKIGGLVDPKLESRGKGKEIISFTNSLKIFKKVILKVLLLKNSKELTIGNCAKDNQIYFPPKAVNSNDRSYTP